jgi:hypothetical protein
MSYVLPALGMASTVMQGIGQYQQGEQQKKAYDYNASQIEAQGALKVFEIEGEEAVMAGRQRAAYAKAGVMNSGSALEVEMQTQSIYEFDKIVAKYNADSQAGMQRYYGAVAQNNARFKMGQTLLGGAIKMGDYMKIPTNPSSGYSYAGNVSPTESMAEV